MAQIIDSYSESNKDGALTLAITGGNGTAFGQSFTGNGYTLTSSQWFIAKNGSPAGNAVAKIYTHSGTFGTSSVPTGTALATSDNLDVSTLTTSYVLNSFTFSGTNRITLVNGIHYIVTIEYSGGSAGNGVLVGDDTSSPTAAGNASIFFSSSWSANASMDFCFYVYGTLTGPFPTHL